MLFGDCIQLRVRKTYKHHRICESNPNFDVLILAWTLGLRLGTGMARQAEDGAHNDFHKIDSFKDFILLIEYNTV